MKDHSNVTLSLPEPVLRRFRIYAAEWKQSMSALMAEAIQRMMDEKSGAGAAKRRILARLKNPPGRLPGGKITWSREELHEREPWIPISSFTCTPEMPAASKTSRRTYREPYRIGECGHEHPGANRILLNGNPQTWTRKRNGGNRRGLRDGNSS